MNNFWFFGDSFTEGAGCIPTYEFYEKYPEIRDKKWTTIVSDTLGFREKNLGNGGTANDTILRTILQNIPFMEPGDVVSISSTHPVRVEYIHPITLETVWTNTTAVDDDLLKDLDKEYRYAMVDYISLFINQDHLIGPWVKYHTDRFQLIADILKNLNITTFIWDVHPYIHKFESIYKYTDERIEDYHWSWNGHREFANLFLNEFVKDNLHDKRRVL